MLNQVDETFFLKDDVKPFPQRDKERLLYETPYVTHDVIEGTGMSRLLSFGVYFHREVGD